MKIVLGIIGAIVGLFIIFALTIDVPPEKSLADQIEERCKAQFPYRQDRISQCRINLSVKKLNQDYDDAMKRAGSGMVR